MVRMLQFAVESHDSHNGFFTEHSRQNRNSNVDLAIVQRHSEMSVLRQSPLGDIQV